MTEGLEFSTDILRAFSTEQRIRRTDIPRRRFSCTYAWTERVYETARSLMRSTHPGPFEIPDWAMWQKITVEAGTSLIPVDTSAAKYVDRLIIMDRYDAYEAFDIVSVTDAGVTIDGAVSRRFRDATVAPLIEAYAMQGLSAPRTVQSYIEADVEWVNFTGPDLIDEATVQEYGRRTIATIETTEAQAASFEQQVVYQAAAVNELQAWSAGVPHRLTLNFGDVGPVELIQWNKAVNYGGTATLHAGIIRNGVQVSPTDIEPYEDEFISRRSYITDVAGLFTRSNSRGVVTPLFEASVGEWFLGINPGSATSVGGSDQDLKSSFMMFAPEIELKRALIKSTSDQFASQNVQDAQINYGASVYDTGGFWDPLAPAQFTIPTGISRVMLIAGTKESSSSSSAHGIEIRNNGRRIASNITFPADYYNTASGPVEVEAGDVITVHGLSYYQYASYFGFPPARDRTYQTPATFLSICETVGRCASVGIAQQIRNNPFREYTIVPWSFATFDDLGYWSQETPERLTVVTAGWHQVGAVLYAGVGNVTQNNTAIRIERYTSGGTLIERYEEMAVAARDDRRFFGPLAVDFRCNLHLQSQHMLCEAGEYFVMYTRTDDSGGSSFSNVVYEDTKFWIRDFKSNRTRIDDSPFGEYLGHPLLIQCAKLGDGSFAENVQHLNNMIDNGIALPFFDTNVETPRQIFGSAWQTERGRESFELRKAFYGLRGRQTAFWAPLWTRGMRPLVTIGAADTTITIPHIGYAEKYPSEHIYIRDSGGNVYAREVTSSVNNGDDTETLTIDSPLGVTLTPRNVRSLSRLLFCRILADRIEIQHRAGVGPKIVLPLEEVPFFTDDYLSPTVPPESDLGSDDAASDDEFSQDTFSDSNYTSEDADSDADIESDDLVQLESDIDVDSDVLESEDDDLSDEFAGDLKSDDEVSDDPESDDFASNDAASDDAASDDGESDDGASDDFVSDNPPDAPRTILQLTSDVADTAYPFTISWPTPVLDGLGAYNAGQPTRLTIQENGDYIVYAAEALTEAGTVAEPYSIAVLKNGSESFTGRGRTVQTRGTDPGTLVGVICQTAPIPLVTGDYLEVSVHNTTTGNNVLGTADMKTEVMLYKVPALRGALAYLTSDNTAVNGDNVPAWDAELYDTDAIWSSGAAANFVMPGAGYASGTLNFSNLDGTQSVSLRSGARWEKGGVDQGGKYVIASDIDDNQCSSIYGGPIIVAGADVLQAKWRSADTSYTQSSAGGVSSAAVEFHNRDCVIAGLSGDLTAINATGGYTISWTSEIADDVSGFSTVTNPSRITSPGGWVQAGVNLSLSGLSAAISDNYATLQHFNAAGTLLRIYSLGIYGVTALQQTIWTRHIETTAGDYFVVRLTQTSADTSINILALGSRFWMEVYDA